MKQLKQRLLRQVGFLVGAPAILWQVLFLWLPLACLIYLSFTQSGDLSWYNLSWQEYGALCNLTHFKVIFRSFMVASFVTLLCLIVAYPVAYYLALYTKRLRSLALFLLTVPFWINSLVHIYAWFFILEHGGLLNRLLLYLGVITTPLSLINNLFATIVVMFHVYLPFMIMPIYSALEKFNRTLIESSLDLGATHWQTFWHVTVPLSLGGVRTGVLLVFVMCFGEYAIPILLGGSKTFYVGSLMTEYFLIARDMPKGAAFMVLSSLGLILVLSLIFLAQRSFKSGGSRS